MPFYSCASECSTSGIKVPPSCEINPRDGGINRLIFIACDAAVPEDPVPAPGVDNNYDYSTDWGPLMDNCQVMVTGRLKGQSPKGSVTSEKLTSCLPETPTGAEKSITFMDYNAYDSLYDYDFWNEIYFNQSRWNVMAVGCDGRIYPATSFTIDVDEVIPEDSKSPSMYDGAITIQYDGIMKPFYMPQFVEYIESRMPDCGDVGNPISDAPFDPDTLTRDDILI